MLTAILVYLIIGWLFGLPGLIDGELPLPVAILLLLFWPVAVIGSLFMPPDDKTAE